MLPLALAPRCGWTRELCIPKTTVAKRGHVRWIFVWLCKNLKTVICISGGWIFSTLWASQAGDKLVILSGVYSSLKIRFDISCRLSSWRKANEIFSKYHLLVFLPSLLKVKKKILPKLTWTATWGNVPSDMCVKSTSVSVQSDQSLRCPHGETLHTWLSKMRPGKILIRIAQSDQNLPWAHMSEGKVSDVEVII